MLIWFWNQGGVAEPAAPPAPIAANVVRSPASTLTASSAELGRAARSPELGRNGDSQP